VGKFHPRAAISSFVWQQIPSLQRHFFICAGSESNHRAAISSFIWPASIAALQSFQRARESSARFQSSSRHRDLHLL